MRDYLHNKLKTTALAALLACSVAAPGSVLAEAEWMSVTVDNDTFVGNDVALWHCGTDPIMP